MRKQKRSNESSTRLDRLDRKTTYRDFIFDQLASLVQKRATKSHKSQFERKAQYTLGGNASAPVIRHYYADSARARAVERRSGGSRPWCLLAGTRARVQRAAAVAHPHRDRQIVRNGRVHRSPKGREPARARAVKSTAASARPWLTARAFGRRRKDDATRIFDLLLCAAAARKRRLQRDGFFRPLNTLIYEGRGI